VWRDGQVAAVLDWDRVRVRLLGEEVVRSASYLFATADRIALDLGQIAAFTAGYRTQVPLTRAASDEAADRTWWQRMTDLWILRFRYDRADPSCDHLYAASSAVLEWWNDQAKRRTRGIRCRGLTSRKTSQELKCQAATED